MEEQFILRFPPSVAERLERLLSESASTSEDQSLDLSFSEDGRSGTFVIGNDHFPASLLDLPCVVESYKTYDDCALVKAADIGQPELVQRVEKDLLNIMAGGTVENAVNEQEEDGYQNARNASKKTSPAPATKPDIQEAVANAEEPERSNSDESDDSI